MKGGAKTWYFPDGYLPEKNIEGSLESHEALMILNAGTSNAYIDITIYFEDKDPIKGIGTLVLGERVKTLRLDYKEDMGGVIIPILTQYSLRIESDVEVVVQFGRLDATQTNLAYYGTMGFRE